MTVYLVNAFSVNMLALSPGGRARVVFEALEPGVWLRRLRGALEGGGVVCAVGHAGTAGLLEELLGARLGCRRQQVAMRLGDEAFIVTVGFRLPEARVYTREEIEELMERGMLRFYHAKVEAVEVVKR